MADDGAGRGRAVSVADLRRALLALPDALAGSIVAITRADQATGDGDHGLAVERGLAAMRTALEVTEPRDVGELFTVGGAALLRSMGGASGAIYGTLFRAAGERLRGRDGLDGEGLAAALEAGLVAVRERGRAAPGDRTVVDALGPAADAARAAGGSFAEALTAASAAAQAGAEATRAMRPRVGRARTVGERAIGHIDPGALSFSLLLDGLRRLLVIPEEGVTR